MATYTELRNLFNQDALRNRVEVALIIKAHAIVAESAPSDVRVAWGKGVLSSSTKEAESLLKYVLAANATLTLEQINGASDANISVAVDTAIDALYA